MRLPCLGSVEAIALERTATYSRHARAPGKIPQRSSCPGLTRASTPCGRATAAQPAGVPNDRNAQPNGAMISGSIVTGLIVPCSRRTIRSAEAIVWGRCAMMMRVMLSAATASFTNFSV
jgi:hypothetical protein